MKGVRKVCAPAPSPLRTAVDLPLPIPLPDDSLPQNIEKFTIRTINSDGRLSSRDLAVVVAKRLFLRRNLPVACRRLVAEQARLAPLGAEATGEMGEKGVVGESKTSKDER